MLRRCLLLVFALSGFRVCTPIFSQDSAAPAPSASAADTQTKLRARDEVWQQAQALQSAGKAAEAITAGERVLALERELYGNTHAELTGTIEWLSQQYLAQQNLPQAETYAVELQRVQEALHGKAGWQSVSARWRLDYVRKLSKVEPATLTRMLGIEAEVNRLLAEGKQAEAAAEREKLIPLEEAALGSDYPFFANTFANQADCLLTAEQFAAAETAASRALSIRRKQLGDQHPDTAMAAFLLVRSLIGQDRHSEAVERLILARDAWLASGLLVDAAWMDSWRGDSLVVLKRYAAAKAAYEAALAVFREQKEAEGEAQQLTRLSNLADVYVDLAAWSEAESLREEILRLETARLGEQHWQVIDARLAVGHVRLLATLTDEQRREVKLGEHLNSEVLKKYAAGALSAAIPDAERICEIRKTILGDRHPDYATSLDNLGSLYLSMSDASKAEPLHVQALEIRKAVLGDRHPDYASSLNKLAGLYESMGVPGKAEPLYLQALEIRKAVLGERHPDYARVLNNLLGLYVSMSDFAKAAPLLVQLLEIQKAVLGDRHPDYARGLNSLAALYLSMGDFAKAEPMLVQSLEIQKGVLGDRHPDYATSLNGLAVLYSSMGDPGKAEPLYLQSLEIQKAVLGDRHPDYARGLNNLAGLYKSLGDALKAERLFVQALEIRKSVLGDHHPDYAASLNNLAELYASMGDYAKAEPL
ncbi:MAG: tetratricopeptide repeat protein, partial [Planctomyces sp.]